MQSTLTSREADPHDIFVIEPDVVLAARADHADPISSLLTPPVQPAAALAAPVPPLDATLHAPANDDIQIPRDIHVSGQRPPRGKWAGRVTIGFLFALCSAAAAEGWDRYGDTATETAKAVIATWAPSLLTSQPAAAASTAAPPATPAAQDQASAPPAPVAQDTAATATASTAPAPTAAAPDQAQSLQSMAQDVASMGQQIASLKASIEQLKASQDQMAQQMSRDVARTPVARTSAKPAEPSLRAKVNAALSPRPLAPPPRRPRPAYYAPAQTSAALPPAISAPPMPPQPAPLRYEPREQTVDQADGDVVMRPPMPVR